MVVFHIKVSGKQSVKVPGLLGEKGAVQCIWSTAVSGVIHEAGGTSSGQGLAGCLTVVCLLYRVAYT